MKSDFSLPASLPPSLFFHFFFLSLSSLIMSQDICLHVPKWGLFLIQTFHFSTVSWDHVIMSPWRASAEFEIICHFPALACAASSAFQPGKTHTHIHTRTHVHTHTHHTHHDYTHTILSNFNCCIFISMNGSMFRGSCNPKPLTHIHTHTHTYTHTKTTCCSKIYWSMTQMCRYRTVLLAILHPVRGPVNRATSFSLYLCGRTNKFNLIDNRAPCMHGCTSYVFISTMS